MAQYDADDAEGPAHNHFESGEVLRVPPSEGDWLNEPHPGEDMTVVQVTEGGVVLEDESRNEHGPLKFRHVLRQIEKGELERTDRKNFL